MFDISKCSYFKKVKHKFLSAINKTDYCWIYTKSKNRNGYGQFYIHGKNYETHKIAYMLLKGPIPHGKIVRHICDNPICVNPEHLILGTHYDNSIDSVKRNRQGCQKLNEEAVKVIKWMLKYKYYYGLAAKLARLHGVTRHTINDIKHNRSWGWINI